MIDHPGAPITTSLQPPGPLAFTGYLELSVCWDGLICAPIVVPIEWPPLPEIALKWHW